MAPKWTGKKNNKKKGKSDGTGIAAGIAPSASIATLPCTSLHAKPQNPLSQTAPAPPLQTGSRGFATTQVVPPEDLQTEETDTSLYDYDNARETYPFGSGRFERSQIATPPPPPEFEDRRTPVPDDESESVHSRSSRSRRKKNRGRLSSPHGTQGTAAFQHNDDPTMSTGRHSHVGSVRFSSTRSSRQEVLSSGDWQAATRSLGASTPRPGPSHSEPEMKSVKLESLQRASAELRESQKLILGQLEPQRQQQKTSTDRLHEQALIATNSSAPEAKMIGSALLETQSVTDNTLQKQDELIGSYENRIGLLEQENAELNHINEQMVSQISELRQEQERDMQSDTLRRQLQDSKDERDVLRVATQKLNAELSRYQTQFRHLSNTELDTLPGLPFKGPKPPWLVNTKYLAPLLVAYDDRLRSKDEIINDYKKEMDWLRSDAEKIVKENERLHLRLEQTDSPSSMTEWRQLQEQCKLVLEENALLVEQLELQQNKAGQIHKAHVLEVSHLSQRLLKAEAAQKEAQLEVSEIKNCYGDIKQLCDSTLVENKSKMAIDHHLTAVSDLKISLEEQKTSHDQEVENLKMTVQVLTSEKKGVENEKNLLRTENGELRTEVKVMQKSQRKLQRRLQMVQKALLSAECKELTAEHYLKSVVKMAEKTAMERDTYADAIKKQEQHRTAALKKVYVGNAMADKLNEQLQKVKMKASEKLWKAEDRIKEQDNHFNTQRHQYEEELRHLRWLVSEKEEMLNALTSEKQKVECDLETMWQVASADNRQMRDQMKTSIRKLREHPHLCDIISDTEDPSPLIINLSEDEEK